MIEQLAKKCRTFKIQFCYFYDDNFLKKVELASSMIQNELKIMKSHISLVTALLMTMLSFE